MMGEEGLRNMDGVPNRNPARLIDSRGQRYVIPLFCASYTVLCKKSPSFNTMTDLKDMVLNLMAKDVTR